MEEKRVVEKIFGIELCTWSSWDEAGDYGEVMLYKVEFKFESMKKYNGRTLYIGKDKMEIYSENGEGVEWSGYAIDIPEFWDEVKKYKGI